MRFGASGTTDWPLPGHNGVVQSRVEPIRVVIVDDNPEFLDSARRLLEHQGVRVVVWRQRVLMGCGMSKNYDPTTHLST